jgi:hypothetical protein
MDPTTRTTERPAPTPRPARRRRFTWLWGAVGALLLVLISRFVTSGLVAFSSVTQRSCQGGFCVERVSTPDLLFVPGDREIHVGPGTTGVNEQGRYFSEDDPFDEYATVTISWDNGSVSITDEVATLTWEAGTLTRPDH